MVEQGTHKPLVGSSTLPPGTKRARRLRRLEPIVRRAFTGRARLARGSTLLVAVSGGADSVALLVTLVSLAPELGVTLHAAHLHHGLRGRDADLDLRHVRALCRALGVPLTATRWDCAARMRRRGLTGEDGLRTLRREWLARVARATGAGTAPWRMRLRRNARPALLRSSRQRMPCA